MAWRRLFVIATIAALLAPWVAPCLAAAPGGHASMPCCRKADRDTPVARPCCGPARDEPSAPPASDASGVQPAQAMAAIPALASPLATPSRADLHATVVPPIAARLRSSVLLI